MSFKDFTSKIWYKTKKHSPEILTGFSILSSAGATVLMYFKAQKVKDKIEEHKQRMEEIHHDIEMMGDELTEKERRQLIASEHFKTALEVGKEVAPVVGLQLVSMFTSGFSAHISKERYNAVSGALAAAISSLGLYRRRVAEKLGDEEENKLYLGVSEEEIEKIYTDEKGKEHKKKEKKITYNPIDPYSIMFEETTSRYFNLYENNALRFEFIKGVLRQANSILGATGKLYLAEVYDLLGYEEYLKDEERLEMARQVGWVINKHDQIGDDYVSFGIENEDDQNVVDFVEGKDAFVLLTFNCCGSIYSEIPKQYI